LPSVAHAIDRLAWYLSPVQLRRRLREYLTPARARTPGGTQDRIAAEVNSELLRQGLIHHALDAETVMDLVDPHARGSAVPGFDAGTLIQSNLAAYRVRRLIYSDFLGETVRRVPWLRRAADVSLRILAPRRGSLFSWLVQKPGPCCPEDK
jgi:hypothetical protein